MNRSNGLVLVAVLLALLAGSYLLGGWSPGNERTVSVEQEGGDRIAPDANPELGHESAEVMIERADDEQERVTVADPIPALDLEATADPGPERDELRVEDDHEVYKGPYKYMGPASREQTPFWVFDAEYPADLGLSELQDLHSALLEESRAIREALLDARYEAGLYDVTPLRMSNGFPEGHIARVTVTVDREKRVTILPFDEFPDVYEGWDRVVYAAWRVRQLEKAQLYAKMKKKK